MAAGKAGAELGLQILWIALAGAVLKFSLAEGVARWHLATGTTVISGWAARIPNVVRWLFLPYLVLWSVVVCAALMAACGLAAHALIPALSVPVWGLIHAVLAALLVWAEGYGPFESIMKWAVGLMVAAIIGAAFLDPPHLTDVVRGVIIPSIPANSLLLIMGVIGGVGGSVTLLSYNYWVEEKGWAGRDWLKAARLDLLVGYGLTGLFGIALVMLTGTVLFPEGITISGSKGILTLAGILGDRFGHAGRVLFLLGFWGAVASSMLGVWQGVPYLFADVLRHLKGRSKKVSAKEKTYRGFLIFMVLAAVPFLIFGRPVWLVVIYAAMGSLFMPFLAVTLLAMNNQGTALGRAKNGFLANLGLTAAVGVFLYLAVHEVMRRFFN